MPTPPTTRACVLLEVCARDADALGAGAVGQLDDHAATLAQWHVVLRDLVALGQVWVEVLLAVELGAWRNGAV